MAGSTPKEEPVLNETWKKLKTPTPYSGKCEDLQKFLQEVKIYLWENKSLYPTNDDKILFIISYMSDGDANTWKEEFFEATEQAAAQNNSPDPTLGTYEEFIKKLTDHFSPYDAPKDAIHKMKEMQMNNTPIEEHVAKFKMLVTKSKLAKNDAVVEYFRETLPFSLQKKIMDLPTQPTNLEEWYTWAIQLQNNYIRMRSAIAKSQNKGSQQRGNNTQNTRKPPAPAPRWFYFELTRDPNTMDIDYMSTDNQSDAMKKGLCFKCGKPGHRARDPQFHLEQQRGAYIPLQQPPQAGGNHFND